MALTAELTIEGKSFPIIMCEYGFIQNSDRFGKPVFKVNSRLIKLELPQTNDETSISWVSGNLKKYNGNITFYNSDQTIFKEIKFEEGYCIKYKETVQLLSSEIPYRQYLEISANVIIVGESRHENHWAD